MPRKKRYDVKVHVLLTREQAEFLEDMVREGRFESVSHGIREAVKRLMEVEGRGTKG